MDYNYADNQSFTTFKTLNKCYIQIVISFSGFKLAIYFVVKIVINYCKKFYLYKNPFYAGFNINRCHLVKYRIFDGLYCEEVSSAITDRVFNYRIDT